MSSPTRRRRRVLSTDELVAGVLARDRATLGRAITLVESNHPDHQRQAQDLLTALLPHTGHALRVGITGVPGAGKSTLIEHLGLNLVAAQHRLAVLTIDPSSALHHGSILGDKTRMPQLAASPDAFIRPSPSGGSLGGVARKTRESLLVCEAAGFDVLLVETVGVGQSEASVADMVDFFLVLLIAGGGDELQGIKRGVLELADAIAINKADGDNQAAAQRAARDHRAALRYLRPRDPAWQPRVLTCSALSGHNLDTLWQTILDHHTTALASGAHARLRQRQQHDWMWRAVDHALALALRHHPDVQALLPQLTADIDAGRLTPTRAAQHLLNAFGVHQP